MLNVLWIGMMVFAVIFGIMNGKTAEVVQSITGSAKFAFEMALGLAGVMILWLGVLKIAEECGLVNAMSKLLSPVLRRLFKDVPEDHPAMGAMSMNIAANMFGLGNGATPFGLKAMKELDKLNLTPGVATNAMCTFLTINTSSVQLIPTTAIAYLTAAGAAHPTDIIVTSLIATTCSTLAGLISVKWLEKWTSTPEPSLTASPTDSY